MCVRGLWLPKESSVLGGGFARRRSPGISVRTSDLCMPRRDGAPDFTVPLPSNWTGPRTAPFARNGSNVSRGLIWHPLAVPPRYSQSDPSSRSGIRNQPALGGVMRDPVRMRQTFMRNSFSAFRNAIFSLASRGRSTARNQSVPCFMSANG